MIQGYFRGTPPARRPFVTAGFTFPSLGLAGDVRLLVDTGADSTILAPLDALNLGMPLDRLPAGTASTGVGGTTPTVSVPARLMLGVRGFSITLRILTPRTPRQQRALSAIPSLLGRDVLAHFALFMEERSERVLLLEPQEAVALRLPA